MKELIVTSPAFQEGGWIPEKYAGRGEDVSPPFELENLAEDAVSLAVILNDASHPLIPNYNHWIIWNLPAVSRIPEAIPHGQTVPSLSNAVQGLAYGKHRYRGPKPPLK